MPVDPGPIFSPVNVGFAGVQSTFLDFTSGEAALIEAGPSHYRHSPGNGLSPEQAITKGIRNKMQVKRALPKPGKLSSKRLCLFFVVFETVFLVEAVHTAIGLREFLTSSIEWV